MDFEKQLNSFCPTPKDHQYYYRGFGSGSNTPSPSSDHSSDLVINPSVYRSPTIGQKDHTGRVSMTKFPGDLPLTSHHGTRRRSSSFGEFLGQSKTPTSPPVEVYPKQSAAAPIAIQRSRTMDDDLLLLERRPGGKRVSRARASPGRFRTAPISFSSIDEIREVDEEDVCQFPPAEPVTLSTGSSTDEDSDAGSSCGETGSGDLFFVGDGQMKRRSISMPSSRSSPASLSSSPAGRSAFVLPPSALRLNQSHLFSSKMQHHRSFESLSQLKLGLLLPPIPEEKRGGASQNLTSPLSPTPHPLPTPVLVSQQSCPSFDVPAQLLESNNNLRSTTSQHQLNQNCIIAAPKEEALSLSKTDNGHKFIATSGQDSNFLAGTLVKTTDAETTSKSTATLLPDPHNLTASALAINRTIHHGQYVNGNGHVDPIAS